MTAPDRWLESAHDDAPRDDQGRPIHPDHGRLICARPKSDKTSPTEHGRERDDVPYCLLAAGWGTERDVGCCSKHHAPKGDVSGPKNPNYRHGLYAEIDTDAYSEEDLDLLHELDGTDEIELLEQLIRLHAVRYRRAHDALPPGLTIEERDDETGQREIQLQPGEMQLASLSGQLASLIDRYHKLTEGEKLSVEQETEITGGASITVEWQVAQAEKEDDGDVELVDGEPIELE